MLGICYGLQLMAHLLGGTVRKGDEGEYGLARARCRRPEHAVRWLSRRQQIWMSHRDVVTALPERLFRRSGRTGTCAVAAMAEPQRRLYGVQFHPEVVHTARGPRSLSNFLFSICGCERDWDPADRVSAH